MFELTKTFTHTTGFRITPIEMQGVGFVFLPKELENQLGYENLSDMIRQSESFSEGLEYLVLRNSNLLKLKELLNRRNTIPPVPGSLYELLKHSSALIVLTEAGLYTVTFLSRKPNAQAFRRWVTGDVLPAIRQTGMYKMPGTVSISSDVAPLAAEIAALRKTIFEQQQTIAKLVRLFAKQEQFQQYALRGFERIEAVLADSQPHDMFEGWRKIKGLVDDVTAIYGLSNMERKRYLRELCQAHQVVLLESISLRQQLCTDKNTAILEKIGQLITLPETGWATKENVASFFQVDVNTIDQIIYRHKDELISDGYSVLSKNGFENLHNVSFKIPNRGLAVFPRRCVLRIGMLLRDSVVARLVRSYLLNAEERLELVAHSPMILQDMMQGLEHHSEQLVQNAMQLTQHADELESHAEQLRSQTRMIKVIVDEIYRNRSEIQDVRKEVKSNRERIIALEKLAEQHEPESEYITPEQVRILQDRVKGKGKSVTVWAKLKLHFGVTRYIFLPREITGYFPSLICFFVIHDYRLNIFSLHLNETHTVFSLK